MKTEQAIKLLHRLQDEQFDGEYGDERREALDMAVMALSGDGDTISRKMAIDAMNALPKWADKLANICLDYSDVISVLSDTEQLPSAQPQRKKGEWEEIEVIPEAYDIAGVKTWASMMRCNQCGFTTFAIEGHFAQYDFCPSCGADMRTEGNDDN